MTEILGTQWLSIREINTLAANLADYATALSIYHYVHDYYGPDAVSVHWRTEDQFDEQTMGSETVITTVTVYGHAHCLLLFDTTLPAWANILTPADRQTLATLPINDQQELLAEMLVDRYHDPQQLFPFWGDDQAVHTPPVLGQQGTFFCTSTGVLQLGTL